MPDFRVSPLSIVNQIRSNLEERYGSGYPILKELLQNADDAGARRFRIESFSGWPQASNPLLRGPGLLVINDGAFKESDEQGITSFGESGKATDDAAIGKFDSVRRQSSICVTPSSFTPTGAPSRSARW